MSAPIDPTAAPAGRGPSPTAVQQWLDALAAGADDQSASLVRVDELVCGSEDAAWEVLSLLDQYYRRGKIKAPLFQVLKSHVQHLALGESEDARAATNAPAANEPAHAPNKTMPVAATVTPNAAVPSLSLRAEADPREDSPRPVAPARERMPAAGDVLRGRYRIVGQLGQGGMGTVFEAVDLDRIDLPQASQKLAVKVLHTAITQRPQLFAELRSEFQHLQSLSHPNIVRVHEFDRDGDMAFFTMELLIGAPLGQRIASREDPTLDRSQALAIIRDVGAALAHAHSRGVIHGDINPQNIFILRDGEVRVLDFGASHKLKHGPWIAEFESRRPVAVATPAYASCQVLEGEVAEVRDDVFGFACIIYLLLAGRHPFQGRTAIEARDAHMIARRPAGIGSRQWRVLQQGLNFDRERRPADLHEWLVRLRLDGPDARRAQKPGLAPVPAPHGRWVTAIVCMAGLIVLALAGLWFQRNFDWQPGRNTPLGRTAQPIEAADAPVVASDTPPPSAPVAVAATAAVPQPAASPMSMPESQSAAPIVPPPTLRAATPSAARTDAPAALPPSPKPATHARVALVSAVVSVPPPMSFALVGVHRKGSMRGDASFRWWTESGTAKSGRDFAPIAARIEHIGDGKSGVNLIVPVVADPTRREPRSFYVLIDEAVPGTAIVDRSTTMVTIEQSE
ncbi:MAG: protein kinase [Steroidobacteraceae bacterium]|jgi:serine/threonine protein kinase